MKFKGYLLAAVAAATYGTNPAFALPLYADGMNPTSVLLFRYLLGLPILAVMMVWRRRSLKIRRHEVLPLAALGIMMAISSLTLFEAYNYMNSGIASTLLFVYPVMVAVLMAFFFHERFRITTGICLIVMGAGLFLLLRSEAGFTLSLAGCLLVFLSSLTYALYIVMTNVSKTVQGIPTLKLLFWQLLFGSSVYIFMLALGTSLTLPVNPVRWVNVVALAALPTVVSLSCTTVAIHTIGPTPTAIFGALEPVTAVALSALLFDQTLTVRELCGGLFIIVATTMVVVADPIDSALLRMRRMFPSRRKKSGHIS